jgi:transcription elongation factor Elf1
MAEIGPCPFCKSYSHAHVGHHGGWSQVHCDNCGAKGYLAGSQDAQDGMDRK